MTEGRHLHLLRHAKSSWGEAAADDHERSLAPRGRHAARAIAEHVRAAQIAPALVLCSSARRAQETLELIAPALGPTAVVLVERQLYGASGGELLGRLKTVSDDVRSVMIVGHNPGLEDLATTLAGSGVDDALSRMATKFPTGALATFRVPANWRDLGPGAASLTAYVVPRELG